MKKLIAEFQSHIHKFACKGGRTLIGNYSLLIVTCSFVAIHETQSDLRLKVQQYKQFSNIVILNKCDSVPETDVN